MDGIHEDLNRVHTKPYITSIEQDSSKETDEEASNRWWAQHLSRENSIIVDLFHGQYKTEITCPYCKKQVFNYDSFMYLSLPIPNMNIRLCIKAFEFNILNSTNYINDPKLFTYTTKNLYVHENMLIQELINNISKKDQYCEIIVVNSNNKSFKKILNPFDKVMEYINSKEDELVAYTINNEFLESITKEIESNSKEFISKSKSFKKGYTFYYNLVSFYEETNFLFSSKKTEILDYPYMIILNGSDEIINIYETIYNQMKDVIKPIINSKNSKFNNSIDKSNLKFSLNDFLSKIDIFVLNTLPELGGFFSSSKSKCEFCDDKCNYCYFNVLENDNKSTSYNKTIKYDDKINKLMNFLDSKRINLVFYVSLKDINSNFKSKYPKQYEMKSKISKNKDISIFDCLELQRSEETLENNNSWYCNVCKMKQEASLKMQIYKQPLYLIVIFNRFKDKATGFFSSKKNDVMISYPLELDLKDYVISQKYHGYKYELFAVNQHYGNHNGGHYTATCKNKDIWIEYDDSSISRVKESDVVCKSAYMLFYKLKL